MSTKKQKIDKYFQMSFHDTVFIYRFSNYFIDVAPIVVYIQDITGFNFCKSNTRSVMKGQYGNGRQNMDCAMPVMLGDTICLCNSLFNEDCRNELKEINKHEIIIKICEIMGPCPDNLCKAEEIFEKMKYVMANYVIHHEFNSANGISTELLLWLDTKSNPKDMKKLDNFIKKFFK